MIDLDTPVDDDLLLVSLSGALDYLTEDLRTLPGATATVTRRWPDALRLHYAGPLRPLAELRCYATASVVLGEGATEPDASSLLGRDVVRRLGDHPSFRVADIGAQRWPWRDALEAEGARNEPADWRLNLDVVHDLLVAEVGPLHQTARFGELLRIPASTTPVVSAVLARLVKAEPGALVLDPFCGAGTNLVTAGEAVTGLRLLGSDVVPTAVEAAAENLRRRGLAGRVLRADAVDLPLADGSVDRVVANLPFGKRVGTHRGNLELYPAFLREVARLLTARGRAVLLTEEKRLLRETVQRTGGIRVIKEVELATGGLHPSAYVVVRGRARAGSRKAAGRRR